MIERDNGRLTPLIAYQKFITLSVISLLGEKNVCSSDKYHERNLHLRANKSYFILRVTFSTLIFSILLSDFNSFL